MAWRVHVSDLPLRQSNSGQLISFTPNNARVNIWAAAAATYTCSRRWSQLFPAVDMLYEIWYALISSASRTNLAPVSVEPWKGDCLLPVLMFCLWKQDRLTVCLVFFVGFQNNIVFLLIDPRHLFKISSFNVYLSYIMSLFTFILCLKIRNHKTTFQWNMHRSGLARRFSL